MKVENIIEHMSNMYTQDLEMLFDAISNAKLPVHDYVLGESKQLESFKNVIKKNR
tara:strand:+ start:940 stop:1104 length:165 start_codon:yes stop_codon:yes gene_type:complete